MAAQEVSGNLNLLRLGADILALIQGGILVLAESGSWSVHRSQSLVCSPGIADRLSHSGCTGLVAG